MLSWKTIGFSFLKQECLDWERECLTGLTLKKFLIKNGENVEKKQIAMGNEPPCLQLWKID